MGPSMIVDGEISCVGGSPARAPASMGPSMIVDGEMDVVVVVTYIGLLQWGRR